MAKKKKQKDGLCGAVLLYRDSTDTHLEIPIEPRLTTFDATNLMARKEILDRLPGFRVIEFMEEFTNDVGELK